MERRDQVILLLLLSGVGYAGYEHREEIVRRLGLDDLAPGRIKALELAKKACTFDPYHGNGLVLDAWLREGTIQPDGELWTADRVEGDEFRVVCHFKERGQPRVQEFAVNTALGTVRVVESARPPR